MNKPTPNEVLLMLREMLVDGEDQAFSSFSVRSDSGDEWIERLEKDCHSWMDLLRRARLTLERSGVSIPKPYELRRHRESIAAAKKAELARQRKERLDQRRCRLCGYARGHLANCPKRKKK